MRRKRLGRVDAGHHHDRCCCYSYYYREDETERRAAGCFWSRKRRMFGAAVSRRPAQRAAAYCCAGCRMPWMGADAGSVHPGSPLKKEETPLLALHILLLSSCNNNKKAI